MLGGFEWGVDKLEEGIFGNRVLMVARNVSIRAQRVRKCTERDKGKRGEKIGGLPCGDLT